MQNHLHALALIAIPVVAGLACWRWRSPWHSELTGIFRIKRIPLKCWYPGGPLSETWNKVEFRD